MMGLPLVNQLKALHHTKPISLHVPGHKNMTIGNLNQLDFTMDMTEITGLDDLHHPEDVLLESMETIHKHPNYDAFYLVNGTTSGILSVIQSYKDETGRYGVVRNAHKSVFHAVDLTQQPCHLFEMTMSNETKQYIGPRLETLHHQLNETKLAILTYPNYYGECVNIANAVQTLHAHDVPVLVDEAHGAHFDLEGFPHSAMQAGADYVVQSYHKTLPALTMGSVIFIHKEAPVRERVIKYLSYFQTSSPSYLVMSSLELAHQFYNNYKSAEFFNKRQQLINALSSKQFKVVEVDDPLKLIIQCDGYQGFELQEQFESLQIYTELADEYQVLFVLPLWHDNDNYPFELLLERIKQLKIEKRAPLDEQRIIYNTESSKYYPGDINDVKEIDIDQAENEILATHIVPYPPGIPLMFKGEKISNSMVKLLHNWHNQNLKIEGLYGHKIKIKDDSK